MLPGNLGKGPYARRRNPESLRLEEEKGKDSGSCLAQSLIPEEALTAESTTSFLVSLPSPSPPSGTQTTLAQVPP